jgi:DegV family protein with EDD domain
MSSGLSGSCQTARQLAMDYGGKVVVADNHRISVTLYESVLEARRMADAGMGAYDIAQHLEAHAVDSSIYITVDSLEYLKRSGRVTPAGAAIANVLNLKPVLTIQGGKLDAYAKVRGMRLSKKRMIEATADDLSRRFSSFPKDRIRIGAAGTFENPEDAAHWRDQLAAAFPECQVYYQPLSCSIACHVGIDAVGLGISCVQS